MRHLPSEESLPAPFVRFLCGLLCLLDEPLLFFGEDVGRRDGDGALHHELRHAAQQQRDARAQDVLLRDAHLARVRVGAGSQVRI